MAQECKNTWRKWLNAAEFDWNTGILVYQKPEELQWVEGAEPWSLVRVHDAKIASAEILTAESPILDQEFEDFWFPLIFARDDKAVYMIHWTYAGAGIERIPILPQAYLSKNAVVTPIGGD